MNKKLDELLCDRYPSIFADRNKPKTHTNMCFGFTCGDGWFDLIDTLCERLQFWTNKTGASQVVAFQVKEKFGALRFYVKGEITREQQGMIDMAQRLSERLCDQCGCPGQRMTCGPLVITRCSKHMPSDATPLQNIDLS